MRSSRGWRTLAARRRAGCWLLVARAGLLRLPRTAQRHLLPVRASRPCPAANWSLGFSAPSQRAQRPQPGCLRERPSNRGAVRLRALVAARPGGRGAAAAGHGGVAIARRRRSPCGLSSPGRLSSWPSRQRRRSPRAHPEGSRSEWPVTWVLANYDYQRREMGARQLLPLQSFVQPRYELPSQIRIDAPLP